MSESQKEAVERAAEEARRVQEILRSLGFGVSGSLLDAAHEVAEYVREKRQPRR